MEVPIKTLIVSLTLLFSSNLFAKPWAPDSSSHDKILHLFICTEEAPVLCRDFNLSVNEARNQVHALCGNDEATLVAIWKNNRITDILCQVESSVTNAKCMSIGFDCALDNQCVKDLSLKGGVNTSSAEYQNALLDIMNNPSHITKYPNFYNICKMK